jgi:thiopeptide-type bacteriocin biosynthesis protein
VRHEAAATSLIEAWTSLLIQAKVENGHVDPTTEAAYLEVFLRGGSEALKALIKRGPWVQISVSMQEDPVRTIDLFSQLKGLIHSLFSESAIDNFFFMRKPPGFRFRFQAAGSVPDLTNRIQREAVRWQSEGLILQWFFGTYEPEAQLFGGPKSVCYVDTIFTLDSMIWLESYSHARGSGTDVWATSFAFLQALFKGLDIVGWEDLGVWSNIVEHMGRKLPADIPLSSDHHLLKMSVLDKWKSSGDRTEGLNANTVPDPEITKFSNAVRDASRRWKAGYFDGEDAWIGARQAAAYVTIFHWNRAGLSAVQQALIAETLAKRRVLEDQAVRQKRNDAT